MEDKDQAKEQAKADAAQAGMDAMEAIRVLQKALALEAQDAKEDKEERATGSVRNMLQNDMDLKKELLVLKEGFAVSFKQFARRQIISIVLCFSFLAIFLAWLLYYFNTPTKLDKKIFNAIQHERKLIIIDRDSLRAVIDELVNLRK